MFILLIFGIGMGVFVSAIIFRLGSSAEWLGWSIPMVLSLFAGVYSPNSTLPPYLHAFAKLIPASYVFESMRSILKAGAFPGDLVINLFIGALLAFIYLLMASRVFIYIYRKNLESGTIARFNTEVL